MAVGFDRPLSHDIEMLLWERPTSSLVRARLRLKNVLLAFGETPALNPEAASFHERPTGVSPVRPSALDLIPVEEKVTGRATEPNCTRRRRCSVVCHGAGETCVHCARVPCGLGRAARARGEALETRYELERPQRSYGTRA
jgi:hypothetical protein